MAGMQGEGLADEAGEDQDEMSMGNPFPVTLLDCAEGHTRFTGEQTSFEGAAISEASLLPLLPAEQQAEHTASGSESDTAPDREQLLIEHLSTVRYIARRIHERLPQHVELDDLISAGVVGLIDAFSKFDHNKKVQFKSYAQFRIRGAILDSLRTLDWSPRELRRKGRAVEEAIRSATQRLGRAPLEQEIATAMELSLANYQRLLGDLKGLEIGSLHMERTEDSGDEELAYIPGAPEDDPLFRCLKGEMKQRLADAIDELPEKERMVLTLYYYEELTMKEIGLTLGVVESRVSQIHSSAVLRLRTALAGLKTGAAQMAKPVASTKKLNNRRRREA
jgi:RNA polymerase sigma factor for flagellar operon FliA